MSEQTETKTLKNLAARACLDIFEEFSKEEIEYEPVSIRCAWKYGEELRKLYPKRREEETE